MAKSCTFGQSAARKNNPTATRSWRLLICPLLSPRTMVVTASRDIDAALAAAQCVVRTHERLVEFICAGKTLADIDAYVAETLKELNCRSAFLNYSMQGHPPFRSHSCLSLNDCIVHGEFD